MEKCFGMFLTWSSQYNISHFYEQQIFIILPRGILVCCLFSFSFGPFKSQRQEFSLFLITTVALWWFSAGGIFSTICYFFRGCPYYRHIGLVVMLFKSCCLCVPGLWEHFWSASRKTKIRYTLIILAILLFLADAFHISSDWIMDFYMQGSLEALIEKSASIVSSSGISDIWLRCL